jgi:hypothetical protein
MIRTGLIVDTLGFVFVLAWLRLILPLLGLA